MKTDGPTVMAVSSVCLGILAGAWLWRIPFAGLPVAIASLALGWIALKTARHSIALTGILISLVALFLVLLNLGLEYLVIPGLM